MIWSFSWCDGVRVPWCQVEVAAAILKHESSSLGNDTGAKVFEDTVDEGDTVTRGVGYSEVDGVAVIVGRTAFVEDLGG